MFEVEIRQWLNPQGFLQSGQCCDPQVNGGQRCSSGDQCDTFFKACLKEYQARVSPTGTCTYGTGSTPVLGGNSHTLHHHGNEGSDSRSGRIVIPFKYAWPVSTSNLSVQQTQQTSCFIEAKYCWRHLDDVQVFLIFYTDSCACLNISGGYFFKGQLSCHH